MSGFVENVNRVAQGLTPTFAANVEAVAENILDVNAVAADIADVAIVADNIDAVVAVEPLAPGLTTIVANITEILAAEDNAAVATTQAGIATAQATAAADSAASAATSKTDADNAALAAAASATTATTKASEASTSATNAASSAASATTSASTATTKAGEASASASSAATSASTATTKANEASASAISAGNSATSAGDSASNAAASASTATTKATEASNSASSAAGSAASALVSAVDAEDAATAAGNSATAANLSATSAAASASSAATLLDQFDDRYLGAKASDPAVGNDGNALAVGALYYNTTTSSLKIWTGSEWNPAAFDVGGMVVSSFNTRTGDITLTSGDVTTALGFTPEPADATIVKEATVDVLINKTLDDVSNLVGADHVHYRVRNSTGSTINIGTVVKASATQPGTDYILIEPVTDPQTQVAIGIVHQTLVNNAIGLVINTGVQTDFNTSAWAVGTMLYPNTTGGFTSTKPTSGQYQACAYVLRQHSSSGTLLCEFTEPKLIASTAQAGYVQLNDTLTSTSSTQALTAAQGKALQDGKQPLDATLTALADVTTSADEYIYATGADTFTTGTITSFGRSLVDDVDASTARGTLGLGSIATQNADTINITGGSISGITDLAIADGGTGASDAANARTNLGISATNTPFIPAGNITATNVQAAVQELDSEKAPLESPALTGIPTAPTAAVGTNTTQVATTEFVQSEIANDTFSKTELAMAIGNINSPLLDMPLKNSLAMKAGVGSATFTRASTATYIDRYGVLKTAAIDEPRFEKEGYLNEGSSTNLFLQSEDFSTTWTGGSVTVSANTADTTDPYGTNLADKITDTTQTNTFSKGQSISYTAGVTYTFSVFAKKGTKNSVALRLPPAAFTAAYDVIARLDTGTIYRTTTGATSSIVALADGWYRISVTATATTTASISTNLYIADDNTTTLSYTGNGTGSIYIFGAQLEALPFATSYIPTTSATVTRSADVLNITYLNNSPASSNTSDYSCLLDFDFFGVNGTSTHTLFRINDDGRMLRIAPTRLESRYGGVLLNSLLYPVAKTKYRIAHTIGSVASIYVNGALSASGSRGTTHTTATVINIGQYLGTTNYYGYISNIRIYDKALTAQEVALA